MDLKPVIRAVGLKSNTVKVVVYFSILVTFAMYVFLVYKIYTQEYEEQERAMNLWQMHFGSLGIFGITVGLFSILGNLRRKS